MLISVVIATLDRPGTLRDAVSSVAAQTYDNWQVVVVDDGSRPAVDARVLAATLGERFVLCRHEACKGIPQAKNAGLRAASGDVVLHLDDDDLLAPRALEKIASAYAAHPELDCLFLNVQPFGPFAPGAKENQDGALRMLLSRVQTCNQDGLVFFEEGLFEALLKSVPLALQRPAARRSTWARVGPFTEQLLFSEPDWTIRAAMTCRTALIEEPLSLWRCEGQNFASRPEKMYSALQNQTRAAELLLERVSQDKAQAGRIDLARRYLADTRFNLAYYEAGHRRGSPWTNLCSSFVLAPEVRHVKLAARLALGLRQRADTA
ncbi:MAG TPA: glycosyltransferase [Burkholderiales bacterium]|nr:glycosyltransferase [Burkholderiales bacterium]